MCDNEHYFVEVSGLNTCINCGLATDVYLTNQLPQHVTQLETRRHLIELNDFCINNNIPKAIYFSAEKLIISWNVINRSECLYALYRALIEHEASFTLQELSSLSCISLQSIRSVDYKISMKFHLKPLTQHSMCYIDRFAARLNVTKKSLRLAKKITPQFAVLGSYQSHVYAAAALYHVVKLDRHITLKEVSEACSTSTTTLSNLYKLYTAKKM